MAWGCLLSGGRRSPRRRLPAGCAAAPGSGWCRRIRFSTGVRGVGCAAPRTQSRSSHRIAGCGRPPPPAPGCCRGPGGRCGRSSACRAAGPAGSGRRPPGGWAGPLHPPAGPPSGWRHRSGLPQAGAWSPPPGRRGGSPSWPPARRCGGRGLGLGLEGGKEGRRSNWVPL